MKFSAKKPLIMLLFVIVLIALYIAIFGDFDYIDDVIYDRVKNDINNLNKAVLLFQKDYGEFPKNLMELSQYYKVIPRDPWGDLYIYEVTNDGYKLTCCISESTGIRYELSSGFNN